MVAAKAAPCGAPARREVSASTTPGHFGPAAISFTATNIVLVFLFFFFYTKFSVILVFGRTRATFTRSAAAEHAIDTYMCAHTRNRRRRVPGRFRVSEHVTTRAPDTDVANGGPTKRARKNTFLVTDAFLAIDLPSIITGPPSPHVHHTLTPPLLPPVIFARVSWFRRVMRFIDFSRTVPKSEIVCSRNFRTAVIPVIVSPPMTDGVIDVAAIFMVSFSRPRTADKSNPIKRHQKPVRKNKADRQPTSRTRRIYQDRDTRDHWKSLQSN